MVWDFTDKNVLTFCRTTQGNSWKVSVLSVKLQLKVSDKFSEPVKKVVCFFFVNPAKTKDAGARAEHPQAGLVGIVSHAG